MITWSDWDAVLPKVKQFKALKRLTVNHVETAPLARDLAALRSLESVELLLLKERLPPGIEVFSSVKELKLSVTWDGRQS
ncbi:MAG TPA: hypothetical protein VN903_01880 [Polyangia bacterium]|nr:hypothetical protein [Polyangia bacterium]